jgi:hypothetical protein
VTWSGADVNEAEETTEGRMCEGPWMENDDKTITNGFPCTTIRLRTSRNTLTTMTASSLFS